MSECTDEKIAPLLSDYYSGHLDFEQTNQVRKHLAVCESCRASLRAMELLGAGPAIHSEKFAGSHLTAEQISAYYVDDGSLTSEERSRIGLHLNTCDQCAYDFAHLKDFEADIRASVKHAPREVSLVQRALSYVMPVVRHPALAYFLLLLTVYPTYRFLSSGEQGSAPPAVTAMWQPITESNRSAGNAAVVIRERNQSMVYLDIKQYHNPSVYLYTIRISRYRDNTHAVPVFLNEEGGGSMRLLADFSGFPDGRYQVSVSESDRTSPQVAVHQSYYLFELRTRN